MIKKLKLKLDCHALAQQGLATTDVVKTLYRIKTCDALKNCSTSPLPSSRAFASANAW